ncbi:MAG: hypothetical protein H7X84_07205 [Verrucomicrobia bacterium]|nr:hypothetical protein [Prolixibacteraceae bacterium]
MLSYTNNIVFLIKKDPDSYVDLFKTKIQSKLNAIECRTETKGNVILFKMTMVLRLLRTGRIEIEKIDSGRIKIKWEVKLGVLWFISIWAGLLAGYGFFNSSLLIFMIGEPFISLIPYGLGYYLIKTQIDKLVFTSM